MSVERSISPKSLAGKKVSVIGLGRFGGGVGVTRWLCSQGAIVTVADKAPADQLKESLAAIADLNVRLSLGGHDEDVFLKTDLLVVNPAVPPDLPILRKAKAAGVPWTTEINLFIERCGARIVGITGSVGKSTTTAMTGSALATKFTVHVGGNIGKSLLDDLPKISPDHLVVLELSSFQLSDLPAIGISPHVALVTNLTENHLDRHGTMADYGDAKKNVFRFQSAGDVLILNRDCATTSAWASEAKGKVDYFRAGDDAFELAVPGMHNQANAQAAWAAARQFGITRDAVAGALKNFRGLEHRLQFVAEKRGVRYFNDSKCTTPGGAIVALRAFAPRTAVIILGGYDKHVSFDELGQFAAKKARAVVAIGATKDQIVRSLEKAAASLPAGQTAKIQTADTFEQAVATAADLSQPGDAVLLSPACASYDMFVNYEQRGETFVKLVEKL